MSVNYALHRSMLGLLPDPTEWMDSDDQLAMVGMYPNVGGSSNVSVLLKAPQISVASEILDPDDVQSGQVTITVTGADSSFTYSVFRAQKYQGVWLDPWDTGTPWEWIGDVTGSGDLVDTGLGLDRVHHYLAAGMFDKLARILYTEPSNEEVVRFYNTDNNAYGYLNDNILQALREYSELAEYHSNWGENPENAGGHVFESIYDKMIRGRNRGRMPYLEVQVQPIRGRDVTSDSGMARADVIIRGHCINGYDNSGVDQLEEMLLRAVRGIKTAWFDSTNDYHETYVTGDKQLYKDLSYDGPTVNHYRGSVWGDMTVTINYVFDRDTLV